MTTPDEMLRPEPQPGDILLFSHAHRGRDYLIKWITHSQYYHVGLYAGEQRVLEARPRGVAYNDLRGRETGCVVIPAPEGKGAEALAWAKSQIGDGFERMGMLVVVLEHIFIHLHINYTPRGKYNCSELVAAAFRHTGLDLFPDRASDEVVPGDFARLIPSNAPVHSLD